MIVQPIKPFSIHIIEIVNANTAELNSEIQPTTESPWNLSQEILNYLAALKEKMIIYITPPSDIFSAATVNILC